MAKSKLHAEAEIEAKMRLKSFQMKPFSTNGGSYLSAFAGTESSPTQTEPVFIFSVKNWLQEAFSRNYES